MSTSDLQDEATTEMARAPVAEAETPPALPAEPVAAAPRAEPTRGGAAAGTACDGAQLRLRARSARRGSTS